MFQVFAIMSSMLLLLGSAGFSPKQYNQKQKAKIERMSAKVNENVPTAVLSTGSPTAGAKLP